MPRLGPPEINDPNADLLVVGRDWGKVEEREGRPFANPRGAGGILDDAISEAGLRRSGLNITNVANTRPPNNRFEAHRQADLDAGLADLRELIDRLDPNLIVALGNEASYALVEDWPSRDGTIRGAKSIQELRGYIWEGKTGHKVLTTVHPAAADRLWVPWRMLIPMDLEKARRHSDSPEIERPTRDVEIVASRSQAEKLVEKLSAESLLACDIELWPETQDLACIGFASSPSRAFVFPAKFQDQAARLLEDPSVELAGANFQFDTHFLYTRCGIRAKNIVHDTQLGFHARYPELAGKSDSSAKMTRKGLAFVASLYTNDAWWKGEYENEREYFVYNGRDCCITLDCVEQIHEEIKEFGVESIYRQEVDLIWPVVEMQARGMKVDDEERRRRLDLLLERYEEIETEINEIVLPYLKERGEERLKGLGIGQSKDAWGLFQRTWTCPCCRNGSTKRERCYSCAGFETAPNKAEVVAEFGNPDDLNKEPLFEQVFEPCEVCGGEGQRSWVEMNATSETQVKAVLYELLKLPKRFKKGSLTSDEAALKNLLAEI